MRLALQNLVNEGQDTRVNATDKAISGMAVLDWFSSDLPKRIPSLDGLRAVSIAFVLLSHLIGTRGFPIQRSAFLGTFGGLGVRIFFVISGLLITTLLLQERNKHGSISLRDFYVRRFCRILPASYSYIACIAALAAAGTVATMPGDLLHALTYTMNYHAPHGWLTGHLWSLSVEEQFYLLWPAILVLGGPKRAFWFAAVAIVVTPLLRIGSFEWLGSESEFFGMQFQLCCDALAVGCVLAIGHRWLGEQVWYMHLLRWRGFALIPFTAVVLSSLTEHPRILYLAGYTIMNVAIALSIDRLVRFPTGPVGRFINIAPMRFVGVLSYSLYVWQQLFLNRHNGNWFAAFPQNLIGAGVAALGSYYFIERPFLRLKQRFSR